LTANYDNVNVGGLFSGAYFFNKNVGVQAELGIHEWGAPVTDTNVGAHGNNDGFLTGAGGIIFRYPMDKITPFAHVVGGAAKIDGPYHNPFTWGPNVTAGGGLDYETPYFNHHLAIRLVQADYEYMHVDFGSAYGGSAGINSVRLSTGLVFHGGSIAPPPPVTLTCSASPESVFPGDPVAITATAGNLNPKLNVVYSITGSGVTANGATANVATAALAPGSYTVNCGVKEGKKGREGLKPWEAATATASYTVKQFEPPTISCSANPSTIKPGETSTVTAMGMSPQNRPLTYSYTASAGTVSGTGTTAEFASAGAPTGPVGITCNVSDDKGQTATASTSVTITAPYVPPAPHAQALCSLSFDKDKNRPTRVDNEAKACLDEVALDLQKQSDATAVVVGNSDAKEKAKTAKEEKFALKHKHAKVMDAAAERAVNAKEYLVTEKGIDATRVSVATSTDDGKKVEDYLVPAGASFTADVAGTSPVNETEVKPQVRKPLGEKKHHSKKAK
jgi:outer membrane protein OmpA-like peptidoglycan-associated protein